MLLASLCSCVMEKGPEYEGLLHPGDKLPYFELSMNNGRIMSTRDLEGGPSVIVFFNTACPDCAGLLPEVQRLYDIYSSTPVVFLLVGREEGEESISEFWKKNGMTVPYAACENRYVYSLFASAGIPRVYCADSQLTIVSEALEEKCLGVICDFLAIGRL